ncbi:hypothetical protein H9N25_11865 [Pedobacter riviphilus]|uniref:RHS repeat-associated core domain-containing protein n=1 Tax=Pedobacter riviphilus TaxID=2766984 RepID=A0ABX6TP55_9SPHI|nr:RHS repeat-associated core domain-containing protein [Pedobacter riviphilus]QNR87021.1 hypothetical protein H9N25_11865 [Pedobacter riviphilus]
MLKTLRFIFALSLLLLLQQHVFAAVEPYQNFLKGTIKVGDSVLVKDEKFKNPAFNWSEITNISVHNAITLQILADQNISQSFSCKLKFRVEYFSSPTQVEPTRIDSAFLLVNYDKKSGATYKGTATYAFENGYYVKVYVLDISSPEYGNQLPPVLQLTNQINIDRTYAFKKYLFLGINGQTTQGSGSGGAMQRLSTSSAPTNNNHQLALSWSPIVGAQEYDIEWVPIDEDGEFGQMAAALHQGNYYDNEQIAQMFRNNATRVTTHQENYTISLIYNSKYIAVRMRQVAYMPDGLRDEGNWFYKKEDDISYAVWETPWHQQNLNWQYAATYAEDGKKKEVVSYFDGTLRNRQTATLNNFDNVAVVQENIYDKFGRTAASILPAPFKDENTAVQYLHYFPAFNRNNAGASYNFANLNIVNCEITPDPLSTEYGASKYYSGNNQFLSTAPYSQKLYNKYIPNAGGYPISVTEYTPDNTGRIKSQGGVGQVFQPGQTEKHTTQYFYDRPSQWELDRLFGNDVGYADHYLKNTVIDANGQTSVSYVNAAGKTIATALAAGTPANVDALPNKPSSQQVNVDLINPKQFVFSGSNLNLSATATYNATFTGPATISYDVEKLISRYPGGAFQPYSNAYYDLQITVKDDCGNTIYPTSTVLPPPTIAIGSKTSDQTAIGLATGSLAINFNKIGAYYITFDLKLSKDVIEKYTKAYVTEGQGNGTLKKKQFYVLQQLAKADFSGCFSDCKTAKENLGSQVEFTAMFNARLDSLGERDNLLDYATYISGLYAVLNSYVNSLETACASTPASPCDIYRKPMLADVSPGGQYAPLDANGNLTELSINVLKIYFKHGVFNDNDNVTDPEYQVTKVDGKVTTPYATGFTLEDLVKYWKPIWAEQFLQYHPEHCKLLFCGLNVASKIWDNKLEEKTAAVAGYSYTNASNWLLNNDPFFNGGLGAGEINNMAADLANYSSNVLARPYAVKNLSQVVDFMLYCTNGNTNTSNDTDNWTNCTPNNSCRVNDREWEMYRRMYLDLKNKYVAKVSKAYCGTSACTIGTPVSLAPPTNPGTHTVRDLSGYDQTGEVSFTTYDSIYNGLQDIMYVRGGTSDPNSVVSNFSIERPLSGGYVYFTRGTFHSHIDIVNLMSNSAPVSYDNVWEYYSGNYTWSNAVFVDGNTYTNGGTNGGEYYRDYFDCRVIFNLNTWQHDPLGSLGAEYSKTVRYYDDFYIYGPNNYAWYPNSTVEISYGLGGTGFPNFLNPNYIPTSTPCNVYSSKISRFDNVDYTIPTLDDGQQDTKVHADLAAQLTDACTGNADTWMEKLAPGLVNYANLTQQLRANLIELCSRGGDFEHPFGASSFAVTDNNPALMINGHACSNVVDVIKYTLGLNANNPFTNDLNPWLLDGFYPSEVKQQATDMVISATSSDICDKITALTNAANGQPLFTYLKNTYGNAMTLTQGALDTLLNGCNNCRYLLAKDIQLPVFLQPKANGCITKGEYNTALAEMNSLFTSTPNTSWSNYPTILTNFMNYKFGFVMGYDQYKSFADDSNKAMLCNEPPFVPVPEDVFACARSLINVAFSQGEELYNAYIAEERAKFINAYISTAASAKANVRLQAEQQLYHYTLYYYDLAGNLVRTVPPEGVVLLGDTEIKEVGRNRDGLVNENCNYNGPATASDRNTALGSLSTALQGTGNNAIEMWLYAGNPGARQFIATTPDMKYLLQACQNGNLVNVDIFTLNQTAASSVAITLSNHVTADVSSIIPLQPWSHIVVQGADLARGALQIWINGKQYAAVTGAPAAGCGWAISTNGSGNVVMPDNFALLKYLRIYQNRLMTGDEIAKNANSPCFGVVDVNNPYNYRFNVPAPGDPTTIADNSTQETQFHGIYPAHVLTTTYTYNATNQVVQQSTPDGGISKFWYDKLSRLTFSQNAKQLDNNDYSYTRYDETLGRITEVGQKHNGYSLGAPGYLVNSNGKFLDQFDILNINFSGTNSQITNTVYDAPSTISGSVIGLTQNNLRKRVTASIYRENGSDVNFNATYYSYDVAGNVKTLYQQVKGLGLKRLDYEYDLVSGKVNFLAYQHNPDPSTAAFKDRFYYKYEYDAENRLTKAYTATQANVSSYGFGSTLSAPYQRLNASYQYYLHGPLARMELGPEGALVQGVDYAYTLQGWLKGVNGSTLNTNDIGNDGTDIAKDALAYSLGYYQGDYSPIVAGNAFNYKHQANNGNIAGRNFYNGNISNSTYAIAEINNGATVGYTYGYDQLNRLKNVNQQALGGVNDWSFDAANSAFKESFIYDANGNISSLSRNSQSGPMDNLSYHYNTDANGRLKNNQLLSVTDTEGITNGTDIGNSNYTYDLIGNLTGDTGEGITNIQWSVYGKIKQITKNSGNIVYTYDAAGNRVSKQVGNGASTFYVRDAQGNALAVYDNAGNTSNWREQDLYGSSRLGMWKPNINLAVQSGGDVWATTGNITYELNNHLGNTMATITDKQIPVSGGFKAEVLTAGDYYAFGMAMKGRDFTNPGAQAYRYGFNGKENDAEVNGQQDYGMRIYDARLGRFRSVDPITAEYPELTPYQFASNNPIENIDLDGLEGVPAKFNLDKGTYSVAQSSTYKKPAQPIIKAKPLLR